MNNKSILQHILTFSLILFLRNICLRIVLKVITSKIKPITKLSILSNLQKIFLKYFVKSDVNLFYTSKQSGWMVCKKRYNTKNICEWFICLKISNMLFKFYLNKLTSIIIKCCKSILPTKNILFAMLFITLTASCKAITNISEYSSWNTNFKYSTTVFTNPATDKNKDIFISISNSTGFNDEVADINQKVKDLFIQKGFTINNDPSAAKYRLVANIRLLRKIPFNDFETIQANWNMELSDTIEGENIIRQRNIMTIEKEIARYTQHEDGTTLKLSLENPQSKQNKTIGQIIEAYKNFDISGIILGATAGFLTDSAKNVVLGGVYGGFIFEILARSTSPNSYLLIADIEISEPRCVEFTSSINKSGNAKYCADVKEFDKRIFKQDDYSYRRAEFSRNNEYITYRTTIYGSNAKVFAGEAESITRLLKPLPQMISNSIR